MIHSSLSKLILVCCLIATAISANAQDQLGFHTDNYAGINSVYLNPAGHAYTPFRWDINLVEGSMFFENNYFKLTPFRLLDINKVEMGDIQYGPDLKETGELPGNSIVQDFINDGRTRFGTISSRIMGPSFFFRIDNFSTIGITTASRLHGSGSGITDNLSYYPYFDQPHFEAFEVDKFTMGLIGWSEIGFNYMYQAELSEGDLAIGASVKYLIGHEGAFLNSEDDFMLTKLPGDTLSSSPINFNYGYTGANISSDDYQLRRSGSGMSVDLGVVFTIPDNNDGYIWKFGASILDIGKIKFNDNARQHRVNTTETSFLATAGFQGINAPEEFESKLQYFSDQMLGDSTMSLVANTFSMWLPTAISFQADYSITPNVYINATMVQGMPLGEVGVRRGSLIAVTPRYESRWIGASLPVSVYNWQDLRIGAAARLAFLSFGTSNLGSIFSQSSFTGTDFYIAIKLNPFDLGLKGEKRKKSITQKRKSLRGVKCYEF